MKQTTRIICISLCVLLIALSAAGVIWALYNKFASNEAHADYEDLAGTDTLVNFNQIANWYSRTNDYYNWSQPNTEGYSSVSLKNTSITWARAYLYGTGTTINSTHKYFIKYNSNTGTRAIIWNSTDGNSGSYYLNSGSGIIVSGYNAYQFNLQDYFVNNPSGIIYVNFSMIDLTQMFGAQNDNLTLEQANEYFTADYYSYTTGTTIPYGLDYLEGYQKGIQDFQNSLTATFNNDILGTLSFAANIAGFDNSNIAYDANLSRYLVEGLAGFRLGNSISSPINFHADLFLTNYSGGLYLAIFNYTDNGTLLPLWVGEVQVGSNLAYIDANFNIVNVDTLYFGLFDKNNEFNTSTSVSAYFVSTELKIFNIDVAALVNSAIGQTKSAYVEGGAEYEAIYNKGYLKGIAEQNATIGTMDYIGAAFSGIGSILAIELLPGVPFSLFILLPLMFGLIAFVVKLSKGGD